MNLALEIEYSKANILKETDKLKQQIDAMRPLPADVEGRVMQKIRLDWNYNSNAIEGNKLNYGETVAFLMTGITAKGKPLKDHLDIRGHNEAINFLMSIVKDTRQVTEADIRALHQMILVEPYDVKAQTADGAPTTKRITLGEYKMLPNNVQTATGETHYYTSPEETPVKMRELMEWYQEVVSNKAIHPIVTAALFHHKFVSIHPFDDGNGRLSRILMNLILMKHDYPPAVIKMDDRHNYYALLSQADAGNNWPFVEYLAERLESSLQLYLKGARGEGIDEDEDIDKEIALFKMELDNQINLKEKRTKEIVLSLIHIQIIPFIENLIKKEMNFYDFFFSNKFILGVYYKDGDKNEYDYKSYPFTDLEKLDRYYHKLEFNSSFSEFKDDKNSFGIINKIYFSFEEYSYLVMGKKNEELLYKLYHEPLTNEDQSKIMKFVIDDLKVQIQENIKAKRPK